MIGYGLRLRVTLGAENYGRNGLWGKLPVHSTDGSRSSGTFPPELDPKLRLLLATATPLSPMLLPWWPVAIPTLLFDPPARWPPPPFTSPYLGAASQLVANCHLAVLSTLIRYTAPVWPRTMLISHKTCQHYQLWFFTNCAVSYVHYCMYIV